jgi:hypothetical protein
VSDQDAAFVKDEAGTEIANPSRGGQLPSNAETCPVSAIAAGVFEASCAAASQGKYVFIRRSTPSQDLILCNVEAFAHQCLTDDEELSCAPGYEPSSCDSCRGCTPCAPGTFSDEQGTGACKPCPGNPRPYSPPGSTSETQCEGFLFMSNPSTLAIMAADFDDSTDSWKIDIQYSIGQRVHLYGLSAFFLSKGGDHAHDTEETFQADNFPCGAHTSRIAGSDQSIHLEETACCLQDVRDDYHLTRAFRTYTDGLDLVAANDVCDGESGSNILKGADVALLDETAYLNEFVDSQGHGFDHAIKIETAANDGTGKLSATIVIPDAELYRISRPWGAGEESLTNAREVFIGLLDMIPTGSRIVDAASQQNSVVLTRTQYGNFATFANQNIDYTFLSYIHARTHVVMNRDILSGSDSAVYPPARYAAVSFAWDDTLGLVRDDMVVIAETVRVDGDHNPCMEDLTDSGFLHVVEDQDCAPRDLDWSSTNCPQVLIPDNKYATIYIPLFATGSGSVDVEFNIHLKDGESRNATLKINVVVAMDDFTSWCDQDAASVDLASRIVPRLLIGSTEESAERKMPSLDHDFTLASTEAETLQDGLVTLIVDFDESTDAEDLEVYLEDVIIIHVNPGSVPDFETLYTDDKYRPTYEYDPATRDGRLVIPEQLTELCPEAAHSASFFGCVHKHVLQNKVPDNTEAYLLGSSPTGAQDFMENMLEKGTASQTARQLGREYEEHLLQSEVSADRRTQGLWINPGHKWGATTFKSEYSLSQNIIVYALFGVSSGAGGAVARRLLVDAAHGNSKTFNSAISYKVDTADVVASALDLPEEFVSSWKVNMILSTTEACLPTDELRSVLGSRLKELVGAHASPVREIHIVSVRVEGGDCERRSFSSDGPTAEVDAVIVLEETETPFIDFEAIMASTLDIISMEQDGGTPVATSPAKASSPTLDASSDKNKDGKSVSLPIAIGASLAAGAVLVFGAWKMHKRALAKQRRASDASCSIVSIGEPMGKDQIEAVLMGIEVQPKPDLCDRRHRDSMDSVAPTVNAGPELQWDFLFCSNYSGADRDVV